ncbi:hypothetical protein [Streptomyces sp. Da 82-17]|uniref:hypothetical protein n=1 Tax=Streptomyces sp. Da 82-17 TaxID=3377116 RepID=UPI0038D3990E
MTSPFPRFPPYPVRGVRVLHRKMNCAPQFADITADFEPAGSEGFAFVVADELVVDYEPAADVPGFRAAVADGMREQFRELEPELALAVRVVLTGMRADTFGSRPRAFRVAGFLAARRALQRTGFLPADGVSPHARPGP